MSCAVAITARARPSRFGPEPAPEVMAAPVPALLGEAARPVSDDVADKTIPLDLGRKKLAPRRVQPQSAVL
jgi:hypothetical protein